MTDRSIVVRLRAEVGQYKQALAEAEKATEKVADQQDEIGSKSRKAEKEARDAALRQREAWNMVGGSLLAVGTGITALGVSMLKTGIEYNTLQQTSRAALTSVLGSAKAAGDQMDRLDDFARNSPFSKSVFIEAQGQMLAFGIETRKVLPYLDSIQNAVAAAGGSGQQISELATIFSKVSASGKLTAQDLMEFGNRGVDAATLIGSQMGKTGAQIRDEITAGTLDADQALDALAAGMSARFDGAADNVKNTFAGAMDRVSAAWRDLSSALAEPFVGSEGGGIFTGLLNQTADVMRAIEDLPGPVKAGIAVLGLLGGAASMAAGAYLLLIPRIVETKKHLAELATSAPGASTALSAVGRAAAVAAAGLVVLGTAKAIGAALDGEVAAATEFERALSGVGTGSRDARAELEKLSSFKVGGSFLDKLQFGGEMGWQKNITGLSDAISTFDMGGIDKISDKLNGLARVSRGEAGEAIVGNVDKALAKMVADGNADKAAEGFRYFAEQAAKSGTSTAAARDMLPGYTSALKEADVQARESGYATASLADNVARLTEEWYASANAALGLSNAQIGAAEALVKANELAAEGVRISFNQAGAFDLMDESTRKAVSALNDLAASNLGANEQLRQMYGEHSPQLEAALATQRESYIQLGESFGLSRDQAIALADSVGQIPTAPATVHSLTRGAGWDSEYQTIQQRLAELTRPRSVAVSIAPMIGAVTPLGGGSSLGNLLMPPTRRATGGPVIGPGTGTSDSIPAWLSNGEHVFTAAEVRAMGGQQNVYRFRQSLHAYADGGAVDYRAAARASFAGGGAVTVNPNVTAQVDAASIANAVRAGSKAGTVDGWAELGIQPGQKFRLVLEG